MDAVSHDHFAQYMNGKHSLTSSLLNSTGKALAISKGDFVFESIGLLNAYGQKKPAARIKLRTCHSRLDFFFFKASLIHWP